jgi:predicted DNA-binding transcriptional regulator AlpA
MAKKISQSVQNFSELPNDAHIRIPSLAEIFGCSRCTIHRRFKNGSLPPPVRVLGHRGLTARVVRKILAGGEV